MLTDIAIPHAGLDKVVIPASPDDTRPTLLLTANFTGLEDESSRPGRDVIQVYLGLTNNTDDVISATRPSSLVRGTNMLAMAEAGIRQRLKPMQLATYGIFNVRYYRYCIRSISEISFMAAI